MRSLRSGERRIVGVADEPDDDVLLALEVVQCLADVLDELRRDIRGLVVIVQRRNEILHPRASLVAFHEAQLAERLHRGRP